MADWRKEARRAAIRAGIDPDVFTRQIQQESGFNPSARSPAGAAGIAQIMPGTAKSWGVDPMDPKAALGAAARNMASYVKKYGSYENALRAYNAGPGAIEASKGYAETNKYVSNILGGSTPSTKGVGNGTGGGGDRGMSPSPTTQSQTTPVSLGSQFDEEGFKTAQRRALLARLMQSPGQPKQDNALLTSGLLSAKPPERSDYRTESAPLTVGTAASSRSSGGKTLVVGDSLGVGTAPFLQKDIGGVDADVKVGRPSTNAVSILRNKLAGANYGRIVFDVGTNDGSAAQLERSIRQARQLAPNAEIYVPTVNGPGAAQKNAVIRKLAGGNLHVVDWAGNSRGLGGDGIHATSRGYRSRAEMIEDAMGSRLAQQMSSGAAGPRGATNASPERGGLGKVIGTPHSGTHTLGNWQSDNAVDISMPTGTILQSMQDGVVEKVKGGYAGGASRFDGYQVTVRFKDGNRAFYTHLSKAGVKPGQQIRAGQAIGRSGAANGVEHLHLGVERGDPRKLIQRGGR